MNTHIQRTFALLIVAILVAGCSATAMHEHGYDNYAQGTAERLLLLGIQAYEDGDLKKSSERLTGALSSGLTFNKDKVTAYKYLAFIHCSAGREQQCRDDFVAAVALDPEMQLSPAESGHPVWGPIFRSVKARNVRAGK